MKKHDTNNDKDGFHIDFFAMQRILAGDGLTADEFAALSPEQKSLYWRLWQQEVDFHDPEFLPDDEKEIERLMNIAYSEENRRWLADLLEKNRIILNFVSEQIQNEAAVAEKAAAVVKKAKAKAKAAPGM